MITPENQIPLDDSENSERDDQQSQQDIHSNGFDENTDAGTEDDVDADSARLQAADKASEAAYTLDLDKGVAPKTEPKRDTNLD